MVNHHAVKMRDGGPAPFCHAEITAVVVLAGKDAQLVVIAGVDDFIERQLIVHHGAELRPAALEDFPADFAAGRRVPKSHAAV